MSRNAKKLGKSIEVQGIEDADHFTALPKAIPQMIRFFTTNQDPAIPAKKGHEP